MASLRRLIAIAIVLPTEPVHYNDAAMLHRRCWEGGDQVRKMIVCLIAAVAIHAEVAVLLKNKNFDSLVRHTKLQSVHCSG